MVQTPIMRCAPYLKFIGEHQLHQATLPDGASWKYYDCGPKVDSSGAPIPPLICIHGSSGTCHTFFMQLLELSAKGYRVLSVGYPVVYTHEEWAKSFDRLLDSLHVRQVHLYGTSLGGFLAQVYTMMFPTKVLSLALTNSLCDTTAFNASAALFEGAYAWMPDFFLRNLILESFPKGEAFPLGVGDAIDFQVTQLETLTQAELASRITLNVSVGSSPYISRPNCLRLDDERITMIDSMDKVSLAQGLRDQLYRIHPEAKRAFVRTGGDFPYLARFEEVNLHLIVHLRRNGLREPGAAPAASSSPPAIPARPAVRS